MKLYFSYQFIFLSTAIFLSNISGASYAQKPILKNYSINNGLPSQIVYCVTQDLQGYIWFGTDAGVSRFDGLIFENYTIKDGLSDNEILNIHRDSKGRLWFFALNGKLSYYANGVFFNASNDTLLSPAQTKFEAVSFMEDSDNNIWIGSKSLELFCYTNEGTSQLFELDSLMNHPVNSTYNWVFTYNPSKNKIWVITGYHISKMFEYKNKTFIEYEDQSLIVPASSHFNLQTCGEYGAFFNGTSGICSIINGKVQTSIPRSAIPLYEKDYRFFVDRRQDIWTTNTDNILHHYKQLQGEYVEDFSYSFDETIGAVYFDSEGNTWFTTTGAGVYKASPSSKYMTAFPSDSHNDDVSIKCVKGDTQGNIWFSTTKGSLYHLLDDTINKYTLTTSMGGAAIRNFEFDKTGSLYCITDLGVFLLKRTPSGYINFIDVPAKSKNIEYNFRSAKYLQKDRNNRIFFTSATGILQLDEANSDRTLKYVPYNNLMNHRIYCLYFDSNNNLWFENFENLCCYNGKGVVTYPSIDKELNSKITCLEGVSDSVLAVATYGNGVLFLKNGKIINKITEVNGLAGNLCRQIYIEQDTLYVATNQGFSYFTYRDNTISDITTFSTTEGLPSNDTRYIYARRGKVYVATTSGLCIIEKKLSGKKEDVAPPQVYINHILVNGKRLKTNWLNASYNDDITINYTAITFDQPEKLLFQYNIKGNENDWIETKNTTAILASLKPGDYLFRLRAKKFNSSWSIPLEFPIYIMPPFWQEWWFKSIMFSLTLIATYIVIRYLTGRKYRIRLQQAKAQQALAEERNRIASDMHDDLGADLSNILLMTRMNKKKNIDLGTNMNQFNEIEQFTTNVIGKVDEIIWALNPEQDSLRDMINYIIDYCQRFITHKYIKGSIKKPDKISDKSISSVFRRNVFLVVKEGMNNIIKHSEATEFTIELEESGEKLYVLLKDNGNGFRDDDKLERGNGLLNIKKRIEELHGVCSLQSIPGIGTTLEITVPIQ
ncbi:MAG: hypothetical protein KBF32_01095 [Chitinophagales bacterium]|nr:hypothetical protein [Chitinophagaceae bacterium]MBP9881966.1 hypothetical protein [Chitinophagales bacterium]